jgi:hypothetical protein
MKVQVTCYILTKDQERLNGSKFVLEPSSKTTITDEVCLEFLRMNDYKYGFVESGPRRMVGPAICDAEHFEAFGFELETLT